jgi:flagellin
MRWNKGAISFMWGWRRGNGKTPMALNSVNTNVQSVIALQVLNGTNRELSTTQKRVSTGYRVVDARDDGGAFAVAQSVKSDMAGVVAVNEQLGGVKGILETTFAALSVVSDTMKQLRVTLTRLADGAISTDQRDTYEEQYVLLAQQVASFVGDAFYNGRTLLSTVAASGGGNITAIRNEEGGLFTIEAVNGANLTLPLTAPTSAAQAQSWIQNGGNFDDVTIEISKALNRFGAAMAFVGDQISYNAKKMDAMTVGLGSLVDADLARESSTLEGLKVRQQLGVQTLGLANQGPQVLLNLFR